MQCIFTILCGVAILLFCLYVKFPYFLHDCQYIRRFVAIRNQRAEFRRRKPFYTLVDRYTDLVKRHPDKPFIIFENETYTYQDGERWSNKVARALRDHAGLEEADTVALFFGNQPCFVWLWLGLSKLGCATAMLNYNIRSRSLLNCFSVSGAKVLIAAAGIQPLTYEVK